MLESVVGFLAKVATWAFLVGVAAGIYLGVRYWPEPQVGAESACVVPALQAPAGLGPSG
jgi:hypothetical protein